MNNSYALQPCTRSNTIKGFFWCLQPFLYFLSNTEIVNRFFIWGISLWRHTVLLNKEICVPMQASHHMICNANIIHFPECLLISTLTFFELDNTLIQGELITEPFSYKPLNPPEHDFHVMRILSNGEEKRNMLQLFLSSCYLLPIHHNTMHI